MSVHRRIPDVLSQGAELPILTVASTARTTAVESQMVKDKIREIKDFPKDLEMELTHLILSHQGKLEHASPVVPMTLEGLILYYADEIDSNANAYQRITKREKEPGRKWSSYVSLINRYLYFGGEEE